MLVYTEVESNYIHAVCTEVETEHVARSKLDVVIYGTLFVISVYKYVHVVAINI